MEDRYVSKHDCILPHRQTMHAPKPLPPTAGLWKRTQRKCYSLIILSLQDVQCKKFYTHPSLMRAELKRHVQSCHKYTIHPFSKLSAFLDRLFFILLVHRTIFVVFGHAKPPNVFVSCLVRDAIQIFLIIARFFTGYVNFKSRDIFIEHSKIVRNYLKTYFILDIYLAVEEYLLSKMELLDIVLHIVSIVVYTIRLRALRHVVHDTMDLLNVSKNLAFILYNTLLVSFILHIFSNLIFWVPTCIYHYNNHFPKDSWIVQKKLNVNEYDMDTYVSCFLIVISYFLGASHFDHVVEPVEQLLLFLFTFTGRICTLFFIAKVLIYFGHSDVSESEYEDMTFQLFNYMRSMKVPKEVQDIIMERMRYTYQKKYFNEPEILSTLTVQLKAELFLYGARNLIGKCPLLQSLEPYDLSKLFVYMKSHIFSPNEIIQDYEDVQTSIFFISNGMVAGYTNDGLQFLLLNEGDVLGFLRMNPNEKVMYSSLFVSMETTEVYYIHYKRLKVVMEGKAQLFAKYFKQVRHERDQLYKNCKFHHRKANTVLTQLMKGELLEKPKLRHGYADL